jgi:hypothetical protein
VKALQEYLEETFGVKERLQPEKEITKRLPLYLRSNYDLFSGHLTGRKVMWAEVKNPDLVTPDQLKKQGQALQEILGQMPVAFVFENLETWQRKRLIEKKVGFAEPFRQLYIPQLFTQIKDGHGKVRVYFESTTKEIKPPSQLMLLYHLQVERLEGLLFQEIASLLNYSPMTITRSIKELNALAILKVEGGKEKSILFSENGKELWNKALPYLASPVRETWYIDHPVRNECTRLGGEMALAYYSMLSEPNLETLVMGKDAFRVTKSQYDHLDKKYGSQQLEVWHYDPCVLSKANQVDKLSLYLTMKEHNDERIQRALQNMINEMTWL